jgi:hypothetical protein
MRLPRLTIVGCFVMACAPLSPAHSGQARYSRAVDGLQPGDRFYIDLPVRARATANLFRCSDEQDTTSVNLADVRIDGSQQFSDGGLANRYKGERLIGLQVQPGAQTNQGAYPDPSWGYIQVIRKGGVELPGGIIDFPGSVEVTAIARCSGAGGEGNWMEGTVRVFLIKR